jgi:hypothetical protein
MMIPAKELGSKVWCVLSWIMIEFNVSGCCGHDIESEGFIKSELSDSDICWFLAQQPPVGQGLLIHEVSRSHTTTPHSR